MARAPSRYRQVILEEAALEYGLEGRFDFDWDRSWEPIPWSIPIASLKSRPADFTRVAGIIFHRTDDGGLGHVEIAVLDLASGVRVALVYYLDHPDHPVLYVKLLPIQFIGGFRSPREAADTREYMPADRSAWAAAEDAALDQVQDAVLDELTAAFGPELIHVDWLRPAIMPPLRPPSPEADWQVWRQDDAGNRFLMQERLTREEAEAVVERYERRGHKQTYWATRAPDGAPAERPTGGKGA